MKAADYEAGTPKIELDPSPQAASSRWLDLLQRAKHIEFTWDGILKLGGWCPAQDE